MQCINTGKQTHQINILLEQRAKRVALDSQTVRTKRSLSKPITTSTTTTATTATTTIAFKIYNNNKRAHPVSLTPKSILGTTQTIIKDYQFTKFNQNMLICTITISDLFIKTKWSWVCLRSNLHNVLHIFPFNLICFMTYFRKNCFELLTPSGDVGV